MTDCIYPGKEMVCWETFDQCEECKECEFNPDNFDYYAKIVEGEKP